jgi:hypothetical protein
MQHNRSWEAGSLLAGEKILNMILKSDIDYHSELLGVWTLEQGVA